MGQQTIPMSLPEILAKVGALTLENTKLHAWLQEEDEITRRLQQQTVSLREELTINSRYQRRVRRHIIHAWLRPRTLVMVTPSPLATLAISTRHMSNTSTAFAVEPVFISMPT